MSDTEREPDDDRVAAVRMQAHRDDDAAAPATRRRRRDVLLGAGLASAGAALGAAGFAIVDDDPAAPSAEPISLSSAHTGVRAGAELIDHTWGVELVLTVSGLREGSTYDVVYRSASGDVPAGSFVGVGGEQRCRLTGALLRDRTEAIEVLDEDGATVLRSQLS